MRVDGWNCVGGGVGRGPIDENWFWGALSPPRPKQNHLLGSDRIGVDRARGGGGGGGRHPKKKKGPHPLA